jgi:hypothetical protein
MQLMDMKNVGNVRGRPNDLFSSWLIVGSVATYGTLLDEERPVQDGFPITGRESLYLSRDHLLKVVFVYVVIWWLSPVVFIYQHWNSCIWVVFVRMILLICLHLPVWGTVVWGSVGLQGYHKFGSAWAYHIPVRYHCEQASNAFCTIITWWHFGSHYLNDFEKICALTVKLGSIRWKGLNGVALDRLACSIASSSSSLFCQEVQI